MLNIIWISFFLFAAVSALYQIFFLGNPEVLSQIMDATFKMSGTAFEISIGLTGVMTLWLGLMRVGEAGGAVAIISRLVAPFLNKLFPEVPKDHPAQGAMIMNLAANMLGLDNAATPLGLKAMKELQEGSEVARKVGDSELANILCMVGVAVSGYSSEGAGLWRETVAGALHSLPDPALRALFTFLTCQDEVYTMVLKEEGLLLADRLGFAATFLSDPMLGEWIEEEWRAVLQQGSLEGLLLCGSEKEAVQLLQQYVDRCSGILVCTVDHFINNDDTTIFWRHKTVGALGQ